MILVDTLRLDARTNEPGVLPSADYNLSFNQVIVETCSDSRNVMMSYFASLFPEKKVNEDTSSVPTSSTIPTTGLDTFGTLFSPTDLVFF